MTEELFENGKLALRRKETHGKGKHTSIEPVFSSRMEKREYYKNVNPFDIRHVIDMKGFLNDIKDNWNTYVSQMNHWIQKSPVKKLVVTGIFTVILGLNTISTNAAWIQEYTYQVKNNDKIESIAMDHGVTVQGIMDANGIAPKDGQKILLPKVQDKVVTATILNVRSRPTTESSIMTKYQKGDIVKVAFEENGWAGILIKGRLYYVSTQYLTKNEMGKSNANTGSSVYIIKSGDTFAKIGRTIGLSASAIQEINPTVDPTKLKIGQKINIPAKAATPASAVVSQEKTMNSSKYTIKSGDTFFKIGRSLGVSASAIQELNPSVQPTKLKVGQAINIPTVAAASYNQINVVAQIAGIHPNGHFRFLTSDGKNYAAKASDNLLNELFKQQGKSATLTLEGKRGQQMTLTSLK